MFGLFQKKKTMSFPELKTGDLVYFKEEGFWEVDGVKTGFSRHSAGYNIFFRTDKPYKICYVNNPLSDNCEGFFVEADSLIIYLTTHDCIDRIIIGEEVASRTK